MGRVWKTWNPNHVRPSGMVDIRLRDGRELYNISSSEPYWSWGKDGLISPYDIVAYREGILAAERRECLKILKGRMRFLTAIGNLWKKLLPKSFHVVKR